MSDDYLGYLFDAVDLNEQAEIEARLESDPALRERLEHARRSIEPLSCDDMIDPPLGLAARTFESVQQTARAVSIADRDWSNSSSRPRAVDLAVAATILGVAATLVFPAIASLRGDQARVLCADNLRKIGIALNMYSQQQKGRLPAVSPHGPLNNAGSFALALKAHELIGQSRDLLCPAADSGIVLLPDIKSYLASQEHPPQYERNRRFMSGSYGYILGYRSGSGQLAGFENVSGYSPVVADRPPRPEETLFVNSPNHGDKGQNVLYGDGAVRWLPFCNVAGDDLFRNKHCEIAAGLEPTDIVIGFSEATPVPPPKPSGHASDDLTIQSSNNDL